MEGLVKLLGSTLPRLRTEPLPGRRRGRGCVKGCSCGLTPETSRGFEVIDWVESIGLRDAEDRLVEFYPWQRWLLIHALELDEAGEGYRFRTILVLVARQNGKTLINAVLTLWLMFEGDARLLVGTAQELGLAREVMNEILAPMMLNTPELCRRFNPDAVVQTERVGVWHKVWSDEYLRLDSSWRGGRATGPHGPRYLIKALNRRAGRGLAGVAKVDIDELREQWDFEGWSAISNLVLTVPDAQVWCMSNAGDDKSVLLKHLRGLALSGTESDLFHAEWSAPDGCDQEDPEALAQANPSLGYMFTLETLLANVRRNPKARIENLCQFVDVISTALDADAWAAGADPMGAMSNEDATVCVEVAPGSGRVVAVACAPVHGGRWRLDLAGSWESVDKARVALPELRETWGSAALGWFPKGPAAPLGEAMRRSDGKPIKGEKVSEACMTFADYVDSRRVLHSNEPLMDDHARRTGLVGSDVAWTFDRSDSSYAMWAAAGALHLALNREPEELSVDPFVA